MIVLSKYNYDVCLKIHAHSDVIMHEHRNLNDMFMGDNMLCRLVIQQVAILKFELTNKK